MAWQGIYEQGSKNTNLNIKVFGLGQEYGDDGMRDTPVPIPNTEVKPHYADGTRRETSR